MEKRVSYYDCRKAFSEAIRGVDFTALPEGKYISPGIPRADLIVAAVTAYWQEQWERDNPEQASIFNRAESMVMDRLMADEDFQKIGLPESPDDLSLQDERIDAAHDWVKSEEGTTQEDQDKTREAINFYEVVQMKKFLETKNLQVDPVYQKFISAYSNK